MMLCGSSSSDVWTDGRTVQIRCARARDAFCSQLGADHVVHVQNSQNSVLCGLLHSKRWSLIVKAAILVAKEMTQRKKSRAARSAALPPGAGPRPASRSSLAVNALV